MNTTLDLDTHLKEYSRKEIIGGMKWRKGLIPLIMSEHAKRRISERILGEFMVVPSVIRITENNICSGKGRNGKLSSIKIRLDYSKDKWMFIVVCPNSGVVKTLYINYKDAKKEKALRKEANEKENCCIEETENFRTILPGEGGRNENEEILHGNMEGEGIPRWKTLLRNFWRTIRGRT